MREAEQEAEWRRLEKANKAVIFIWTHHHSPALPNTVVAFSLKADYSQMLKQQGHAFHITKMRQMAIITEKSKDNWPPFGQLSSQILSIRELMMKDGSDQGAEDRAPAGRPW